MPTTYSLMPLPKVQFFGNNGAPLAGGMIYSYYPGTVSPKPTYTTANGQTKNTNPVVLDAQGRAAIWLDGAYDIVVKASDGSTIMTQSNVTVANQPASVDASQFFVGFTKFTVSQTAPTNPSNNDIWVDIS